MPDDKPVQGAHRNPPSPPLDWAANGWSFTGTVRLRTGWFGFAVAEELKVNMDGERKWQRLFLPRIVAQGRERINAP